MPSVVNELDPGVVAGGRREPRVAGQERRAKRFGEGDVGGVIRGDVLTQFPDPGEQQIMRIPGERNGGQIFQSLEPAPGIKFTGQRIATKDLRDFDVEQVGRMKGFGVREQPRAYRESGRGIEQHLQQGGGINDDHRLSRSALTAVAGGTLAITGDRCARRLRSSARVGRSATRLISSSR